MADIFPISKITGKLNVAPLQPAYFQVKITTPHLSGLIPSDSISLLCQRAMLPGVSVMAEGIRPLSVGNVERRPTNAEFQDFQGSFICDGNGEIVKFFHRWMQSIYNFNVFNGINVQTAANLKGYTFEYPERYESIIEITQYQSGNDVDIKNAGSNVRTSTEKPVIVYKLFRAFPHSIGTLQTDWAINNEYHILPVQFYYQSWTSNYLEPGTTYDVGNSYNPSSLDITPNPVKALTDEAVRQTENAVSAAGDWASRHNPFN